MNKIIIAIAATIFAMGTMVSSAQAGMKGKLGIGLAIGAAAIIASQHHRYEERRVYRERQHVRRKAKSRKVYATKKAAPKKVEVAKVEEPAPVPVQKAALSENSSITTGITTAALPKSEELSQDEADEIVETDTADATTDEPDVATVADEAQTANKLDCKKFFPSVGMTLSVPCE